MLSVMLNVIMLNVVILSVIFMSIVMFNAVMLSVVAPGSWPYLQTLDEDGKACLGQTL